MTLRKNCKCCNKEINTRNAKSLGRNEIGLWLNCQCGTTILMTLKSKANNELVELFKSVLPEFEQARKQFRKVG